MKAPGIALHEHSPVVIQTTIAATGIETETETNVMDLIASTRHGRNVPATSEIRAIVQTVNDQTTSHPATIQLAKKHREVLRAHRGR